VAIDLSTPEGRSSYLTDSLSDLINGVDSTYGTLIFDELLKRIDKTIKDFNSEMENIFDELKVNEKKRQTMLRKLKSTKTLDEQKEAEREKKEWEQKLLALYGKENSTKEKEAANNEEGK
tara:strand:- start:147 stop:506 length:360 start_codon:yes stop_codon:yes gene_type:complete